MLKKCARVIMVAFIKVGLTVCGILSIPFFHLAGIFMPKDEDGTVIIKL